MWRKNENDLIIFIRLFIMTEIEKNVLLDMIKWSIGWQYVDILNMVVKICNLLSLIMDGISINRLWHKHTFKYIVEKTMFKHKPNFSYVL